MKERANWMVVGSGNIGTELQRQLGQDYVAERLSLSQMPSYIVRSAGIIQTNDNRHEVERIEDIPEELFPEVSFVAIPSTNDGVAAKAYIDQALERGKIAVTAEKGAMANHFRELRDKSDNFTI